MVKWPKVINSYDEPIVKWIDLCNATMFRIIAFKTFRPKRCLVVAIERIGCFCFDMERVKSWQYVSEKLFVSESDARALADWINAQTGLDHEQQGIYSRDMLADVEEYGLGGEMKEMPLIPEKISE